ncbi:cobalamin-binding protein [Paraglaciecola sp. 2405UD69-4]|uniref:cobalamin-binding protein n=1 Tax=Paraglaciecola sp. 2405UD69-4 TaxID=3391836 RepID=UPI0039C92ABD
MKLPQALLVVLFVIISLPSLAETNSPLTDEQKQQRRIIALAPHLVESLYAIGAAEQIIGTTAHADYPEDANNILRVGNYARLQIEKILQLNPDVIIAWKTGNPSDDLARLEKYNLKVVYTAPTQLEDVAAEILMLGELTGRNEAAKALAAKYLTRLTSLKKTYSQLTPVKIFYEMWSRPLRTVANNALLQQQVELCGGFNPFADALDDYPIVGLEQVLTTLPEVVIQPNPHSSDSPDGLDWQQWQHIPAAKNNFILHPDPDKTHRLTTRMLDEVKILCEQIDSARQFYQD